MITYMIFYYNLVKNEVSVEDVRDVLQTEGVLPYKESQPSPSPTPPPTTDPDDDRYVGMLMAGDHEIV